MRTCQVTPAIVSLLFSTCTFLSLMGGKRAQSRTEGEKGEVVTDKNNTVVKEYLVLSSQMEDCLC